MSRLIVVSNRVPDPSAPQAGGLATALKPALEAQGGVWFGWSGHSHDGSAPLPEVTTREKNGVRYVLTDLAAQDVEEYYQGFANGVLWPLCHYRLGLTDYNRRDDAGYRRVNRLFAERLMPFIGPDDLIWIHDYHLLPLAAVLREKGVTNRIGFFLHIPWPAPDVYLTLPRGKALLEALTACDLIGFQTPNDAANFEQSLLRADIPQGAGQALRCKIAAFPISIDLEGFARRARNATAEPRLRELRATLSGQKLVVGVDRLDYTKGIPQRLAGYRRFLEDNPDRMGQISYLQITPKSRSNVEQYAQLEQEIAGLAGSLAGDFGKLDWTPMRYVTRSFGQNVLAGIYRMAEVGLVTPLRDGMNLVAKEYVAAQDPADPGVLILSRFAGAALELGKGALLVNPYDPDEIAIALSRAIDMPLSERRSRHELMTRELGSNTVFDWCESYLRALRALPAPFVRPPTSPQADPKTDPQTGPLPADPTPLGTALSEMAPS